MRLTMHVAVRKFNNNFNTELCSTLQRKLDIDFVVTFIRKSKIITN